MSSVLPPAKKSLGQCFLIERGYAGQISDALGLSKDDTVLEIGPGRGVLTEELVATPAKVLAVEIDQRLIEPLKEKFSRYSNFQLIHKDFLEMSLDEVLPSGVSKVAGNLPYHLVSEVLFKLFKHARAARLDNAKPWISTAVVMMQKEVADRVVAKQGSRTYGLVSVFAQFEARTELMFKVPASAFRPEPKVDGAVVRLDFYKMPPAYPQNFQICERILRFTFHQRRKMLKSTLSQMSGIHPFWQSADLDFTRRPETLSPTEWASLSDTISRAGYREER